MIRRLTIRVRPLARLVSAFLTIGAFFRTVCYGVIRRYECERMRYESDGIGVITLLVSCCLTLLLSFRIFCVIEE